MPAKNQDPIKLRTIFMGTSAFSENILQTLISEKYNIISVYTQADKKVGRKQELQKSAVKILAEKNKLPVFNPTRFDEETIENLQEQKPDILVVAAYGKILPKKVLELPAFGAINVHTSLLPKYRGPSPIQNAILNGEKETGITIMLMNEGVDTGDILTQKKLAIKDTDTTQDVSEKLAKIASELLLETLPLLIKRELEAKPQDNRKATLCQLIERSDGKIMWSDEAESIYNRYRAFFPWPGIYTFWESNGIIKRIKLNKVALLKKNPEAKHSIGEVFQLEENYGIQTLSGIIILHEVQLEGKESVNIKEFVNGYSSFVGSILK
jgi:methionyl-tRNA formyltransferase